MKKQRGNENTTVVDERFFADTKEYLEVKATTVEADNPTLVGYKPAATLFWTAGRTKATTLRNAQSRVTTPGGSVRTSFWPPWQKLSTTTVRVASRDEGPQRHGPIKDRRHRPMAAHRKNVFSTLVAEWFAQGVAAEERLNETGPLPTMYQRSLTEEKHPRTARVVVLLAMLMALLVLPLQGGGGGERLASQLKETVHLVAQAAKRSVHELRLLF